MSKPRHVAVFVLLVVALCVGVRAKQGATTQPPNPNIAPSAAGTSAISGVAVDGTTDQPLAGVVIYLGPPQHGPPGQPIRQITDAKGRFVFGHLPAYDGYFINASKFGFLEGHYGRASSGQLGARMTVGEGQWVRDIRVVMNRPGAISGTVVDDHGEPIVGAYVRVLRQITVAGQMQLATGHVAVTDDRGMYRIVSLIPGKYYVQLPSVQNAVPASTTTATLLGNVTAPPGATPNLKYDSPVIDVDAANQLVIGRYPTPPRSLDGRWTVYPSTFFPSVLTVTGATPIAVGAGEARTGIDFQITPVPVSRVSGVISGPPESFSGLTVRLMAPGSEDLADGGEVATALVSADGQFTLLNVPAGNYVIDARRLVSEYQYSGVIGANRSMPLTPAMNARGAGSGTYGIFSGAPEGTQMSYRSAGLATYSARQPIAVGDRDVTGVVVTMRKGATVSGRFVWDGPRATSGPSTDTLTAVPAHGTASLGILRSRSDPGTPDTFTIEGLLPGEYMLVATFNRVKSLICGGNDYTYKPFDASAGDLTDCVVTFIAKEITVTGTIRDARGTSAADAGVIAFPVERDQWQVVGFSPLRTKSIQATNSGFFRFQSLPEGDYYFIAVPADLVNAWFDPKFLERAASQATRVHLTWGATLAQDLVVKQVK